MKSILRKNKAFKEFSECCHEQSQIEEELDDPGITEERKNELKKDLKHVEEKISGLTIVLQDGIKVS